MARRHQVLVLDVDYDEGAEDPPHTWPWNEMLETDVELLAHGSTEPVQEEE